MQRLFEFLGETEPNGSSDFLTRQQTRIQDKKASGFIELQVSEARQVVFLYAHGNLAGTYLVENGESRRMLSAELPEIWDNVPTPIRTASISDLTSRIAWLALESSSKGRFQIQNETDLEREIQKWKAENFLGLIELSSEMGQGFAVIRSGEFMPMESAFLDTQGNEKIFLTAFSSSRQWITSICEIPSSSSAFACFALRQGAIRWGNAVLARFGDVAGLKFLHSLTQALKTLIETWHWNIAVNDASICDTHFFARTESAAQAYRAIFMAIGAQMEFVIGNHLSQRILAEMFRLLQKDERAALEAHRLIPAAFTD